MPKVKTHGWSVAGEKIKEKIKPGMPAEQVAAIEQAASDQAIADVYGANWKQNVDAQGRPQEVGIGSDIWLMNVDEEQGERHWAAVARFVGPAAAAAGRERIKRMKGAQVALGVVVGFVGARRRAFVHELRRINTEFRKRRAKVRALSVNRFWFEDEPAYVLAQTRGKSSTTASFRDCNNAWLRPSGTALTRHLLKRL